MTSVAPGNVHIWVSLVSDRVAVGCGHTALITSTIVQVEPERVVSLQRSRGSCQLVI